mgnify:CR=1 FL=1
MARENQGLQITLIVFVMLTIVLGVTTYLFYRKYDEATIKANTSAGEASKLVNDNDLLNEKLKSLKRWIGVQDTDDVDAIKTAFDKDMQLYGSAYPEDARFYRPLLEKMLKTIEEKNEELAAAKDGIKRLEEKYEVREKNHEPKIAQLESRADQAERDLADERSKYKTEVERKDTERTRLAGELQEARTDAAQKIATVETKLKDTQQKVEDRGRIIDRQADLIAQITSGKIDAPDGEILWANQREGTVWVSLGRADNLKRQVTFSVYPRENNNLTVSDKKGSIEITHILGEHLAEARVLEDQVGNPVVPGDRIHTVLWSANKPRRFALAGLIDLDGDGRSDLDTLINLIRINGGEVDCYISDKGDNIHQLVGEITVNTNCLVLGDAPTEQGDPAQITAFTKMQDQANFLRTPKMQLVDLLQGMGWKNMSPVVRYGRGANPEDFRAKPDDGVPRKSTGNVSDLYQKRTPPQQRAPSGSMYHRF